MHDYMRALCQWFDTPSQETKALEHKVNQTHKQLSSQLEKPERKLLLRLVDMEDSLRNQACLNSFVSGFRLANSIHQELAQQRPYSFEEEETCRICGQKTGERTHKCAASFLTVILKKICYPSIHFPHH